MKKSIRIIGVLMCISMIFLLVGCGSSPEDELIGKWKNTDTGETVEFVDDVNCIIDKSGEGESNIKYKATESTITLTDGDSSDSFSYSIVDDKLIVTEELDDKTVFERVE